MLGTDNVTGSLTSESKRYILGPMVEVRLPLHFSFELDALYDHSAIGLALIDRDERFQRVNHRLADLFGPRGRLPRRGEPDTAKNTALLVLGGLIVVGLDVIGDYLTEINVTSPTCFVEITEQSGFDVGAMFADALIRVCA